MTLSTFSPNALRDYSKKDLIRVLDSARGRKSLVIDPTLSGPLSLVAEFALLKEHGVEKIYHMEKGKLDAQGTTLIYITRSQIANMKIIVEHMRHFKASERDMEIHVFMVPKRSIICDRILEEEGVSGDLILGEYHLDMVPLEEDVLSLELDSCFKDLFLLGDTSPIYHVAQALMKFQMLYGFMPRILGKGDYAKQLADTLIKLRNEFTLRKSSSYSTEKDTDFDSIIILDRTVDVISPMRTQLTYEGFLEELFPVSSTFAEIPASFGMPSSSSSQSSTAKTKKVVLNNNDLVFNEIRDLSFEVVGDALNRITARIKSEEESRHNLKTTAELREFTAKLGTLQAQRQSLSIHQHIYEEILRSAGHYDNLKKFKLEERLCSGLGGSRDLEAIEDMICMMAPMKTVMRLLSLLSNVTAGIDSKSLDLLAREMLQTYGHQYTSLLRNMIKCDLIRQQDKARKNVYKSVVESFMLINDYVSGQPIGPSYVFAGYAPISIRLIQAATGALMNKRTPLSSSSEATGENSASNSSASSSNLSWKGWEKTLKSIPGATFEESFKSNLDRNAFKKGVDSTPITLVVYLGGCTAAEISALRFLSSQGKRHFVVLTTGMITGSKLIDMLAS